MQDAHGNPVVGRTRWKRFAAAMVPATAAAGALTVLLATGTLAASFAVSGSSFKVSADRLVGEGFAQYGTLDRKVDGELVPVAVTVIDDAELTNLCQSVLVPTPIGDVTVVIRAGRGATPVEATSLVVDLEQLEGNATFTNIEVGRDASTLDKADGAQGLPGMFAQQADRIVVTNLEQTAWATTAGTFRLAGLNLSVQRGDHECF